MPYGQTFMDMVAGGVAIPGYYCTQEDLEQEFGARNIAVWSNLDNENADTPNTDTIEAAMRWAATKIDARFRRSKYAVPLSGGDIILVNEWAISMAGWKLYGGRGRREGSELGAKLDDEYALAMTGIKAALMGSEVLDLVLAVRGPSCPTISYGSDRR